MAHLRLQVVTPRGIALDREVSEVVAPGSQGQFGLLPGHRPLLAALQAGSLSYRQGGELQHLRIAAGIAQVAPASVTVLTGEAG